MCHKSISFRIPNVKTANTLCERIKCLILTEVLLNIFLKIVRVYLLSRVLTKSSNLRVYSNSDSDETSISSY